MMIDGIPNRPLYFYQKDIIIIVMNHRYSPYQDEEYIEVGNSI